VPTFVILFTVIRYWCNVIALGVPLVLVFVAMTM